MKKLKLTFTVTIEAERDEFEKALREKMPDCEPGELLRAGSVIQMEDLGFHRYAGDFEAESELDEIEEVRA